MNKEPGLDYAAVRTAVDMSYSSTFDGAYTGDAYERMVSGKA